MKPSVSCRCLTCYGKEEAADGMTALLNAFALHLKMLNLVSLSRSRDGSVGIATGYGWTARVQFPEIVTDFSLFQCFETGSRAHPASYPMGTRGSFPGGKAAGE
jgi:hypothetical protein